MPSPDFARSSPHSHLRPQSARIPLGQVPVAPIRERIEPLVRRLALDRIRDLRDDGVTTDYIGRMYGVSGDRLRELEKELRS